MSKLKIILFWLTAPITFVLVFLFGILSGLCESGDTLLRKYKEWCFDYKKDWKNVNGVWVSKD